MQLDLTFAAPCSLQGSFFSCLQPPNIFNELGISVCACAPHSPTRWVAEGSYWIKPDGRTAVLARRGKLGGVYSTRGARAPLAL